MGLRISRALRAQILAEAAAEPEREVCGLLFGAMDEIVTGLRCTNVSPDPERAFEIDPAALIAAHKAERAGGPRLVGCYHSHPNGRTTPSAYDAGAAWGGGLVWLIVAGGGLTAWRNDREGSFQPLEIEPDS